MASPHPRQAGIIEALEARIAPASVFIYTDIDGDQVKIQSSKGNLSGHVSLSSDGTSQTKGYVTHIDLTDSSFQGTNLTFKVTKGPGGDGFANVGTIDAHGIDLGKVVVKGDLESINAGDGNPAKPAIRSLVVRSMGADGVHTTSGPGGSGPQSGPTGPDTNAIQTLLTALLGANSDGSGGTLGNALTEIQDLLGTNLGNSGLSRLLNTLGANIGTLLALGADDIKHLTPALDGLLANIGTDIYDLLSQFGTELGNASAPLKSLLATALTDVNTVVHDLVAPLGLGGTAGDPLNGVNAAQTFLLGLLNSPLSTTIPQGLLTDLNNAIAAVASNQSGQGGLGNLLGNLLGSGGIDLSTLVGQISTHLTALLSDNTSVTLSAFLPDLASLETNVSAALNGSGSLSPTLQGLLTTVENAADAISALPQSILTQLSGSLQAALTKLTGATLPGDLPTAISGLVTDAEGLLGNVTSALGTLLSSGGTLTTATFHDLSHLVTDISGLLGHLGPQLGSDVINALNSVLEGTLGTTGTKVTPPGGSGDTSESLALASNINGKIGSVTVTTDLSNIFLNVAGDIKSLRLGGSLIGGATENSGEIFCTGNIGHAVIGKNIIGGLNLNAGSIEANGCIGLLRTGGSVLGGVGNGSGVVQSHGDGHGITIRGDLAGNSGLFSASVDNSAGRIAAIKISGSLMAGTNNDAGAIHVAGDVGSLNIRGNVIGDSSHSVEITAAGMKSLTDTKDISFGKIRIGGRVEFSDVLAGYSVDSDAVNGHAQIGSVTVKGDWIASNLVAGIRTSTGTDNDFGTNTDAVITGQGPAGVIAKIARIRIMGSVAGTSDDSQDNFSFTAQQIGAFTFGKNHLHLQHGSGNDGFILAQQTGGDVDLHEAGAQLH